MPRYKASLTVSSIGAVDEPTSELHFKESGLYCFAHRPMFSLCNVPLYWFPRMKASGFSGDLKPLCKTGKITVFWDVRLCSLTNVLEELAASVIRVLEQCCENLKSCMVLF